MKGRLSILMLPLLSVGCGYTHLTYRVSEAPAEYRGELWRFRSPAAGQDAAAFSPDGRFILLRGAYACRALETNAGRVVSTFENAGEIRRPLEYLGGAFTIIPYMLAHFFGPAFQAPTKRTPSSAAASSAPPPKPGSRQQPLLAWAGDSRRAFYMRYSPTLKTIATDTGRPAGSEQEVPLGPMDRVTTISPSGQVLAINRDERQTVELAHRSGAWRRDFPQWSSVSFATGKEIASVSESDGTVHILDIESGDELKTFQFDAGSACWMGADGELLLICRTDSQSAPAQSTSVRLIELASGRELAHVDPRELGIRGYLRNWSSASKRGVFYHFPGKRGRADGPEAVIVDLKTGLEIHRLKLEQSQSVLDFSPDGRLLLVSRGPWHLQLFQVAPPD